MTTVNLIKGQNAALEVEGKGPASGVRLTVEWSPAENVDVDVCALLLGEDGRVRGDADFVFYNQPQAEGGAVRLLGKTHVEDRAGDRLLVSLDDLPEDVSRVVTLVTLDAAAASGFGQVSDLRLSIASTDEQPLSLFDVPNLSDETAVVLGELYPKGGAWRFRAIGQGYAAGLAGVAGEYGITVDQDLTAAETAGPGMVEPDRAATPASSPGQAVVDHAGGQEPRDVVKADQATSFSVAVAASAVDLQALPLAPAVAAASGVDRAPLRTRKRTTSITPVRALTLMDDDSWKAARLFPIVGIGGADEQERRATSALLSVLMGVKEFGRAISGRLGAPAGLLETYLEVPFPLGEATVIPDGVLRVARGGRTWTALLEVKTGTSLLSRPQVESYIEVARERGYDAVVTLSNELPPRAGEHPVGVDRRKLRRVGLHHLAWAEVVHEATMQLSHRGVADPTQAWVLSELLRYLQHPRSGASGFEDMGASWVRVRDAVVAGTLRPSDRKAPEVAGSWDRLIRQVCLRKSGELGVDVLPVGTRGHATDPAARAATLVKTMVEQGSLNAAVRIPGAIAPLTITANLRTGQVEVSADIMAPTEGRPLTRVNWLLRQLAQAPDALKIDALGAKASDNRCELLKSARTDPKLLLPEGDLRGYRLTMTSPLGTKRGIGRGGFISSVHDAVDNFYREAVQDLRPWTPPAPKLPAHDAAFAEDQPLASDDQAQLGVESG